MRTILPAAFNDIIGMAKGTSNVYIVAIPELFYTVQVIFHRNLEVIPLLMVATVWYLIILTVLSVVQWQVERRFARGALRTHPSTYLSRWKADIAQRRAEISAAAAEPAVPARPGRSWAHARGRGAEVSIQGVSKSFGALKVLDNVFLDAPAGSVTVILGQSGSGKSTLLRAVNRAIRLRDNLSGGHLAGADQLVSSPAGDQRARVQPHSPTLAQRLWYGGGSLRSAEWAGRNGFNILIGNLNQGEGSDSFFETQRRHIEIFRAAWSRPPPPRIALGRVIVPTDSADDSSRRRYAAFAESRHARTLAPQGERRILFARDLVGTAEQILDWLTRDPILPQVTELRLELPYDLALEQYEQILTDFSARIAPEIAA
jgi:energy-coupling factor transporter ATP-binding protein EcfA2